MRHIFFINPAAGPSDQTDRLYTLIEESCREASVVPEIFVTERRGHATALTRELLSQAKDETLRFYACGGDGTLNEVVCGAALAPMPKLPISPAAREMILSGFLARRLLDCSPCPD